MTATISPASPRAWLMSFTLHAAVVGLIALLAYKAKLDSDQHPRILELVAGPGDDSTSMAAPALGSETSVTFDLPAAAPAPAATSRPPPVIEPAPAIVPAPVKASPAPKEPDPSINIAKQIKQQVAVAKRRAELQAAKDRKKEQERLKREQDRIRKEEQEKQKKEQSRMTKAEFDRLNAGKRVASATPSKRPTSTKYKAIDSKGIAKGVIGGSSASTTGAGGRALTRAEATLLELYDSEFLQKLRIAFEEDRPPGLSDSLQVTISVRSNADGSLTGARVTQSSGSTEFDRSVLDALRRVKMRPRPDRKAETISFEFKMREG